MDETELKDLTLRFQEAHKEKSVAEFLQQNPEAVLVLRLSLGLSQKRFIQQLRNKISQVSLIKHEKGRSSRINSSLVNGLMKLIPDSIDVSRVIRSYTRFESMKKGAHMTHERARELHKIWKAKTKKSQWQEWGRKGALKTNAGQRLTEQEKAIKELLDKMNLKYKLHQQTTTKILDMNIDFVVFDKNKPQCFIEVTERRHDLPVLCQAYAYRCRLLKETYPKAKVGIIMPEIPLSAQKIIESEFDFILNSNSIQDLSKVLQF